MIISLFLTKNVFYRVYMLKMQLSEKPQKSLKKASKKGGFWGGHFGTLTL